jgi:hypothetical protein
VAFATCNLLCSRRSGGAATSARHRFRVVAELSAAPGHCRKGRAGVSAGARSATALGRRRRRRRPAGRATTGRQPVVPGRRRPEAMQAALAAHPRHARPTETFRRSSPRVPESRGNPPISGGIHPKPALHAMTKHPCKSAASRSGLIGTIRWIAPRRSSVQSGYFPTRVRTASTSAS